MIQLLLNGHAHIGSNDMMKGSKNMMKQPLLISSFGKEEEKSTER
jgi:hypothetical protein